MIIKRNFYQQPTLDVAEQLIGKLLVREINGHLLIGSIVETEAYIGKDDSACHAAKGLTPRTKVMFGKAGFSYIYLVYGMHFMLNIVTEKSNFPAAVLIRAVEPLKGITAMQSYRNAELNNLCNGPAKLCQALAINKGLNNWDLTKGQYLWLEDTDKTSKYEVARSTRIGINYANKKDREAKWRFYRKNCRFVSRK